MRGPDAGGTTVMLAPLSAGPGGHLQTHIYNTLPVTDMAILQQDEMHLFIFNEAKKHHLKLLAVL